MKITVIHGQSHEGNTCMAARELADKVGGEIQEFFLPRDFNRPCLGCYTCFKTDLSGCPHYKELEPIAAAMLDSDLLILESPVYVYHATGPMMSFLDHFGTWWAVHRPLPEMSAKQAVAIATAAGGGMKSAVQDMADSLEMWGIRSEASKMLKIEHLTKIYGEKKAVDDLNLHIKPGEIYGFIGHNGAGKTTTLKSVVGILQFDSGEILIDGKSVRTAPLACKRDIAYIPDNPDLYDYMSGIKYLGFIADIFGISAADRQARISKYAELFELTADLAQPISSYSHGMKQKLAIISAWLHRPKLIIMDEPFVGLDPKASHLLKGMMREVCDEGGAIFFSTHVLEVAEKLCDKVAIIKGGKLVRSGTMEEVKGDDSLEEVFLELEGESC